MGFDSMKLDSNQENKFLIDRNNPNILFISCDNDASGGSFISMANLINILRVKYKLNVFVILPWEGTGSNLLDEFEIPFCIVRSLSWIISLDMYDSKSKKIKTLIKKIFNMRAIKKISNFIEENKIDLVHINTTYTYVGAPAAIKNDVPFVWHLREFVEEDQNNTIWDKGEGYNLINKSDKIIVVSKALKDKYDEIFDKNKLIVINNGIDERVFHKPKKSIFNNNKLIFIMVGKLMQSKGQVELAIACSKLYSEGYDNFEVWFIGLGEQEVKDKIIDIFDSRGMDNYQFLGFKKNVEDYYEKADISFTCSDSEAFGRTTVEAMLSGNLVIGTNTACTKELLCDDKGLLYELHDADDLYNKIKFAIENPNISQKIAKNGREYMYNHMTAERNANEVYNLYEGILNKK